MPFSLLNTTMVIFADFLAHRLCICGVPTISPLSSGLLILLVPFSAASPDAFFRHADLVMIEPKLCSATNALPAHRMEFRLTREFDSHIWKPWMLWNFPRFGSQNHRVKKTNPKKGYNYESANNSKKFVELIHTRFYIHNYNTDYLLKTHLAFDS